MSGRLTKEERRFNRKIFVENIRGKKLVADWELNRITGTVYIKHTFTTNSAEFMQSMGYFRAENYLDTLYGLGMPVFMKIHNFKEADAGTNQETSSTLRDYFDSNIDKKMRAGFTKVKLNEMDVKTLVLIVCIAAGAILGFYLLGGGF